MRPSHHDGGLSQAERRAMVERHREALRTRGKTAERLGRLSGRGFSAGR